MGMKLSPQDLEKISSVTLETGKRGRIKVSGIFSHVHVALFRKTAAAVYLGDCRVKPLKSNIAGQAGHVNA
jgi:hypothetical protein